jgi:cobyrinic acid a,c-diamide synthase
MQPKLHLGYRQMTLVEDTPFGKRGQRFRGHEFHYATTTSEAQGQSLFQVINASGDQLAYAGCKLGSVAGSFMHLIDSADNNL